MTIKVYISGICGSQEVRKQQQRVLFILQTMPIDLQIIDVTEPGRDDDLTFMQEEAKKHDKKTQLPPQIFNDDVYCGDYADFELANDDDEIMRFLKLESGPTKVEMLNNAESADVITQNGLESHENEDVNKETIEILEATDSNETGENNLTDKQNVISNIESSSDDVKDAELEKSVADNTENAIEPESEQTPVENVNEKAAEESSDSEEESE